VRGCSNDIYHRAVRTILLCLLVHDRLSNATPWRANGDEKLSVASTALYDSGVVCHACACKEIRSRHICFHDEIVHPNLRYPSRNHVPLRFDMAPKANPGPATDHSSHHDARARTQTRGSDDDARNDADDADNDSEYGAEGGEEDHESSDTSSNYSSVSGDSLPPIQAHGHTYHGSGRHMLPNDESEVKRLALQHELFKLCLDGALIHTKLPASASDPNSDLPKLRVLDVGSGSGVWACEMAQRYPHTQILGIDLSSAMLPKEVPANLTFEIADAAEPWPWPPGTFDFIHMRSLIGGGIRDWQALVRTAFHHLRPGGQLEYTEMDTRFYDVDPEHADLPAGETPQIGAACLEYERILQEHFQTIKIDIHALGRVSDWLSDMGAEGIRERSDFLPLKSWGNDPLTRKKGEILGEMIDSDTALENWNMFLFGLCGWEDEATRELLRKVREEVRDPKLRSYSKVTFITARKPIG
jgi:SAM-dependent methyltransferase